MHLKAIATALVVSLCLASCVTVTAPSQVEVTSVKTATMSIEDVPLDAVVATSAMVDRIWGLTPEPQIAVFDEKGTQALLLEELNWDPFYVDTVLYGPSGELDANAERALLSATLRFADLSGRTVGAGFVAEYGVEEEQRVRIFASQAYPVYSLSPRTEAYFVPVGVLKSAGKDVYSDWTKFYELVKTNAITLSADRSVATSAAEYGCVVFGMDRMAPDAEFKVIAAKKSGSMKSLTSVAISNYEGFRVGIFSGKFALGDKKQKMYINAYYSPAPGGDGQVAPTYKIGEFTNQIE